MIFKYLQLGLLTITNINGQTLLPKKANTPNTDYTVQPTAGVEYTRLFTQELPDTNRFISRYNKLYNNDFLDAESNVYNFGTINTVNGTKYTLVRDINYNAQQNGQTEDFIERTRNAVLFCYKLTFKNYNTTNFKIPLLFDFREQTNTEPLSYTVLNVQYLITNSTAGENYYEPTQTQVSGINDEMNAQEYYRQAKYVLFQDNTTEQVIKQLQGEFHANHYDYESEIKISFTEPKTYYVIGLAELYLKDWQSQTTEFQMSAAMEFPLIYPAQTLTGTGITAQITYEIVNIPGLMFDILTMPFTFISMAFNLTIFPNTPYSINISALFLAILGILVFVMIMRILTKLI